MRIVGLCCTIILQWTVQKHKKKCIERGNWKCPPTFFGDKNSPFAFILSTISKSLLVSVGNSVLCDKFNLLKPSGYFTYHQGLTFKNSTWRSLCTECFVRISEQTATFAFYSINWLIFITEMESVCCAVRTDSLYTADYVSSLKG